MAAKNSRKYPFPGLFVTFEGVDGVGKTTQATRLKNYLIHQGRQVLITREPGGTHLGEQIRQLLLHGDDEAPRTEALLYAASRAQLVFQEIRPALNMGKVVISDRYIDSSLAYQAGGRELTMEQIRQLNEWATNGLWPQRTYLLDMGFEQAQARLSGPKDRLESSGADFFNRTRQAFLDLAGQEPDRFVILNASLSVDQVWDAVKADIDSLLARRDS